MTMNNLPKIDLTHLHVTVEDDDDNGENAQHDLDFSAFGTRLDEVEEKELRWMWDGYLLKGKLNGLIGDADKGKSLVMLDVVARVTRGWPMPLEEGDAPAHHLRRVVREPGNVILLCGEDDVADTIKPRLRLAGADATRVLLLDHYADNAGHEHSLNFAERTAREFILQAIRALDAKLLIVDPLATYMGKSAEADMMKEQDMRAILTGFAKHLADTDCCVWAIRHQGKDNRNREPVHKALGSVAITALFRSEWAVNPDPHDDALRVFSKVKNNLSIAMPSLTFHIADDGGQDGKKPIPFIVWDGVSIWDAKALANETEVFSPRRYVKQVIDSKGGETSFTVINRTITQDRDYKASKKESAIKNLLHEMVKAGELVSPQRAIYALPTRHAPAAYFTSQQPEPQTHVQPQVA